MLIKDIQQNTFQLVVPKVYKLQFYDHEIPVFPQVVYSWNDVHSALTGDFLKVGHHQVLILFNPRKMIYIFMMSKY